MLEEIHIKNLVLIDEARLELNAGLNAFTGETGAGKSLLIDALGLLFGGRGDGDLVRPGADAAEVTARFLLTDLELIEALEETVGVVFDERESEPRPKKGQTFELVVSRRLPISGRSRAHANGRPVALAALKILGEHLLDIHGQHANQSLLRPVTRLEILDRFAEAQEERTAVRQAYEQARAAAEALAALRKTARDKDGQEELIRFQVRELEEIGLNDIDSEAIENELKLLRGAEVIREAASHGVEALDGESFESATALMSKALAGLERIGDAGSEKEELASRLEALLSESRDLARDLAHLADRAESNPQRLDELETLRASVRSLERKHGRGLDGLRALRDELRQRLSELDSLDVRFEEREKVLEDAKAALKKVASRLTRKRKAASTTLEKLVAGELKDLELRGARFEVRLLPHDNKKQAADDLESEAQRMLPGGARATGMESVELAFSANPELPPKPLAECASGGELSRVMLALKGVLAKAGGADRLPVVVFDEVDAGVGGRMGSVLGKKLGQLASIRQVLCVTHLPQVAAYGQTQIRIAKARKGKVTVVTATPLEGDERVGELASMLRGDAASGRTRDEAKEMLEAAQALYGNKKARSRSGKKKSA